MPARIQSIKELFKQISFQVRQFLQNITYNLKAHGINYNALDFEKVVTRIVTPVEIQSHFHISSLDYLFSPEHAPLPWTDTSRTEFKSNIMPNLARKNDSNLNETSYPLRNSKTTWPRMESNSHLIHD